MIAAWLEVARIKLRLWRLRHVAAPDPRPEYSRLDDLDGLNS